MGVHTEAVQKLYVAYFNRPADYQGLKFWEEKLAQGVSPAVIQASFASSPEYKETYAGKSNYQIINQIYNNLFNRDADLGGLEHWDKLLTNKTFTMDQIVQIIADTASDTEAKDKTIYANKVAAATAFSAQLDTAAEIIGYGGAAANNAAKLWLSGITTKQTLDAALDPIALAAAVNAVAKTGSQSGGETFALTTGVDEKLGTNNDDVFTGVIDGTTDAVATTLTALDSINGANGNDTLNINVLNGTGAAGTAVTAIPTISLTSIETVNIRSAVGLTADMSSQSGVNTINVTQITKDATAADSLKLTAASATNVNVATKAVGDSITVLGGKDVTVNLTDVANADNDVNVGAANNTAKGAVSVNLTGVKTVAGADVEMGTVTVVGGSSINVTQKATSDATAAAADKVGSTVKQGAVNITGDAATTAVTVNQQAFVEEVQAKTAVAAKATTKEVVFTKAVKGDVITIDFGDGSLSFTANKNLTAAEVASAFANLAKGVKQGNASAALGIYTDATAGGATSGVTDNWTSGAVQTVDADKAKVVFSSSTKAADLDVTVGTAIAEDMNRVEGETAVAAVTGELGVANGAVTIKDSGTGTIKTVTINGYATGSRIGGTGAGEDTAVLETLNLSNSEITTGGAASLVVDDTAATLALNLEKIGTKAAVAGLELSAAPTTLNVKSTGDNYVNLVANDTVNLNVSGTGTLSAATSDLTKLETIKVTEKAGLVLNADVANTVKSVDTTGTTGTVEVSIQGDLATYAGGAGVDKVTVTNANLAIAKSINLGAGDDVLTLSGLAVDPTVELNGGEGTDTLVLTAETAHNRSAASTFEGKITSFEKLGIGQVGAGMNYKVDMTNMDDINYVISDNVVGATAARNESAAVTFKALTAGQSVTVAGRTVTVSAGASATAAEIAAAYLSGTSTANLTVAGTPTWTPAALSAGSLSFTSIAAGEVPNIGTTISSTGLAQPAVAPGTAANGDVATAESTSWTLPGLTNGQSITIAGVTFTAHRTLTAAEVLTAFVGGTSSAGNYTIGGTYAAPTDWTNGTFTSSAGKLVLTNGAMGNVTDFTVAPTANPAGATPANATVPAEMASAPAATRGTLVIDKLANNGTLELAGAGAGVEVKITDAATGTSDVLNVVLSSTGSNVGTVLADNVETININGKSTNVITIDGDKVTTINLTGKGNVDLRLAPDSMEVSLIDGSTAEGKLTVTTMASDTGATTVKGGSGADVLTAQGANDVLLGGAGADTLKVVGSVASAVVLTGGAGVDLFDVSGFKAANAGAAVTITDLEKGEMIKFISNGEANFASSKVSLISSATFDNYVTEATKAAQAAANNGATGVVADKAEFGLAWFQFNQNTFIVQDVNGDGAFTNGTDIIVQLTGLVDLSASSFNEVGQGTLLYI